MKNGIYDYGSRDCLIKVVNVVDIDNHFKIKCCLIYKKSKMEFETPKYRKLKLKDIKHWKLIA